MISPWFHRSPELVLPLAPALGFVTVTALEQEGARAAASSRERKMEMGQNKEWDGVNKDPHGGLALNPIPYKQPWRARLHSQGSNIPPPTGRAPISFQESPLDCGETLGCLQASPSPHPPSHPAEPILSQATHGYFAFLLLFFLLLLL